LQQVSQLLLLWATVSHEYSPAVHPTFGHASAAANKIIPQQHLPALQ